jgi:hypothetical protein
MRYLLIAFILIGCCTTKETLTVSHRDTVIVYQPEPINVDTLLQQYPYLFKYNAQCDTSGILQKYGGFFFEGHLTDSLAAYRIGWNAASRQLTFSENRPAETKIITIDNSSSKTTVQKTPFMVILGYAACGAFIMLGIIVIIKAGLL